MGSIDDRQAFDAHHGDGTRTVAPVICRLEVDGRKRWEVRPRGGRLSSHRDLQERRHHRMALRSAACPHDTSPHITSDIKHHPYVKCWQVRWDSSPISQTDYSSPYRRSSCLSRRMFELTAFMRIEASNRQIDNAQRSESFNPVGTSMSCSLLYFPLWIGMPTAEREYSDAGMSSVPE
jgi:hypothetical protein